MFFRIYTHLLPRAKAWRITAEKTLRSFFEGLTGLPSDVRDFFDGIFNDIDPQLTGQLDLWEKQFGLCCLPLTEQERRDRLEAVWAAAGGQSPRYIQDTLRAAGFDVYVHEWWEPASDPPVARNPLLVLSSGSFVIQYLALDGGVDAQDGDTLMQDGAAANVTGYPLVNKLLVPVFTIVDGAADAQDGDAAMQDGANNGEYEEKRYLVPTDPNTWPYFLYISGQTFPDHATVAANRKNEFETLCLKICPTQQWLGILVDFT